MSNEYKWIFPMNSYAGENGLSTSEMEIFSKDPIASLAREICQNSIDAAYGDKIVRVVFREFDIEKKDIYGIKELEEQINACSDYMRGDPKESPKLDLMKKCLKNEKVKCLRISDFNTSGLTGVEQNATKTKFYRLTKGHGVCEKDATSAGSKGMGKYASFVASDINTVFYDTMTMDGKRGFIGVSKLRSVPDKEDVEQMTMGIGFFCADDKLHPIREEMILDETFVRADNEYGTDVYIMGFSATENWYYEIAGKVAESFMYAIFNGSLVVEIDTFDGKLVVDSDHIGELVNDPELERCVGKREYRSIKAQYEILKGDSLVQCKEVEIPNLPLDGTTSKLTVYAKTYKRENEIDATKKCVMIRAPYMRICEESLRMLTPCSAMCVIHDGTLAGKLRAIENPQHDGWEIKRLNSNPQEKKITKGMKDSMIKVVLDFVRSVLKNEDDEKTDFGGAGAYLPADGEFNDSRVGDVKFVVSGPKEVKPQHSKAQKIDDEGEMPDIFKGDFSNDGESGRLLHVKRDNPNPNPKPKLPSQNDLKNVKQGEKPMLHNIDSSGMRYRNIVLNKKNGEYKCVFESEYSENNCDFGIYVIGEGSRDRFSVSIIEGYVNGQRKEIKDGKIVGISIKKGEKYDVKYKVNSKEMIAVEVELNAYR